MSDEQAANDDRYGASLTDRAALLDEIVTLRAALTRSEAQIAELDHLAKMDPLVNLPNRRNFLTNLESAIAHVGEHGVPAAVLFLDVDGMKTINDKLGHNAGDKALVKVARLLVASVRQGDLVARLAGDEFGILLEHANELSAWRMALRIVEIVDGSEFCVSGVCLPLSVAVGVGVIRHGDSAEDVLDRADKEMYRIKAISGQALSLV